MITGGNKRLLGCVKVAADYFCKKRIAGLFREISMLCLDRTIIATPLTNGEVFLRIRGGAYGGLVEKSFA